MRGKETEEMSGMRIMGERGCECAGCGANAFLGWGIKSNRHTEIAGDDNKSEEGGTY